MTQPFGLVAMALQSHAADKGLVAAHDHHDQQVGDHDHINQRQYHQHDDGFIQCGDGRIGLVADAGHQRLQCGLASKYRFNQMH